MERFEQINVKLVFKMFSIELMVGGYHINQQVWEVSTSEELTCHG